MPLGLTETASAADAGIHNKILGLGMTTLMISDEAMEDIIKIVKFLEECGKLIKVVSEAIENETKEQKGRISCHVIRRIRCLFIWKPVSRERCYPLW